MSDPIPFPNNPPPSEAAPGADVAATEVTLDEAPPTWAARLTRRLPETADLVTGLTDVLLAPLDLLPPETRAHLRTAGREVSLTVASLAGTLLKGAAIVLNVVAESLKDYSVRNSSPTDAEAAHRTRQRVEIEVE